MYFLTLLIRRWIGRLGKWETNVSWLLTYNLHFFVPPILRLFLVPFGLAEKSCLFKITRLIFKSTNHGIWQSFPKLYLIYAKKKNGYIWANYTLDTLWPLSERQKDIAVCHWVNMDKRILSSSHTTSVLVVWFVFFFLSHYTFIIYLITQWVLRLLFLKSQSMFSTSFWIISLDPGSTPVFSHSSWNGYQTHIQC